ncbi:UDP-N-acetylmuramoyl-L-alanine--D-glutamate ligase [Sulfuriflexus mobilis]|uniref:UDP-N-acetylmuramoyl-L-alanine--D-glutamate ligase n=1 Tax=Sulfuriflexus mobilis TaxID=1811807 RepID=UPI000F836D07|nr:UDP-N-acetylmuramoyl-L-alanine--D-glutamate ligase [Sulfuriflexus mobilis]
MNKQAQQTLVVGLGKTGLSCARHLAARGVPFVITDSRMQPPGLQQLRDEMPELTVHVGGFLDSDFAEAEQIILSPGISRHGRHVQAAEQHGAEVLGDIELFAREAKAPVVAITGTNGKSTVTTLLAEMARASGVQVQVGGNLGMPALELLHDDKTGLYVLELSSFQLETTYSLNAVAAVVLNVTADHMDRYDSVEAYARAKQGVYRGDGVMVINADDPMVEAMADTQRRVIRFSLSVPKDNDFGLLEKAGEVYLSRGTQALLAVKDMKLVGRHNQANALAALALGSAIDLDLEAMLKVLRTFKGLAHRSEWVADIKGVRWYNDSKATNVGAATAALEGMPGTLVLIAGGDGKGADFSALREAVKGHVRCVVLLGRDAPLIELAIQGVVPVQYANDMHDAVQQAANCAQPGDSVLLSPACASFDMYNNFEERGADFIAAVGGLSS